MAKEKRTDATERYTRLILQTMVPPVGHDLNLLDAFTNVARMMGIIARSLPMPNCVLLGVHISNTYTEEVLKPSAPTRKGRRRADKKKGAG